MTLDPADFLEQLATELASVSDRLDSVEQARLEAALTPQETMPRLGESGVPEAQAGVGAFADAPLIADGAVTTTKIANGAITTPKISDATITAQKFASGLTVPKLETSLPTLPNASYPPGTIVFLTTDGKLYRNLDDVWTKEVESEDIVSLSADKITAGTLSAALILAGFISTASTGTRVEFDSYGIRAYNGSTLIANIPTDGISNVYFKAVIEALGLTVTGDAELRGSGNKFAASSVTSLESAVANPTASPSISASVPERTLSGGGYGLCYDTAGGAGGATAVFWSTNSTNTLYENLASTGAVNRSVSLGTKFDEVYGVAREGTGRLWITGRKSTSLVMYGVTVSSMTVDSVQTAPGLGWTPMTTAYKPVPVYDGTNLYLVYNVSGEVRWKAYGSGWADISSTEVDTNHSPGGTSFYVAGAWAGTGDFGAWRMVVTGWNGSDNYAFVYNSSGTRQTNDEWQRAGGDVAGVAYDGTNYFLLRNSLSMTIWSKWTWAAAGNATQTVWGGFSWYDSVGTTHETATGPRASVSMGKRRTITVTTPAEPGSGTADEPDGRRIYLAVSVSDPGASGLKLQITTSAETTTFNSYDSGGAAPPTSNNFPGGTPAQLKSADTGWTLKGSGAINRTGTAFPSGPATNDTFFRSDLGMEFFYDGTRWLSTQLFTAGPSNAETSSGTYYIILSATQSTFMRLALPPAPGSDIYVEKLLFTAYVNSGGSALSASHKWDVEFEKVSVANIGTSIGTATIDSGNSSNWRLWELAVDAVLGGGYSTYPHIRLSATKTGTPGSLNVTGGTSMTYRVVAT